MFHNQAKMCIVSSEYLNLICSFKDTYAEIMLRKPFRERNWTFYAFQVSSFLGEHGGGTMWSNLGIFGPIITINNKVYAGLLKVNDSDIP